MSKKKKHAEHVNLERWLISYADFITLLFAFFVVMFASAYDSDDSKAKHLAKEMQNVFTMNAFQHGGSQLFGKKMYAMNKGAVLNTESSEPLSDEASTGDIDKQKDVSTNREDKYEQTSMMRDQVTQEFFNELKKNNVSVSLEARGLVISFQGVSFFDEGSATVDAKNYALLEKTLSVVRDRKNFIQLEGHADVGESKGGNQSAMEISSKRAQNVADVLVKKYSVPADYISTAGYGSFRPVKDSTSAGNRLQNRRVDLILLKTVPDEKKIALPNVDQKMSEQEANQLALDNL